MKIRVAAISVIIVLLFSLVGCANGNYTEKKEYPVEAYRTTMQYYDDFKILQLTDLHLGIESNLKMQLDIVRNTIRTEKPDLIILTGDNFMYASRDVVSALLDALNEECKSLSEQRGGRLTKFTLTFGNHDNQGDYPRYYINSVMLKYATKDGQEIADGKYAAFIDFEDDDLFGLTNFYIDLVDDRSLPTNAVDVKYRLHIIDSNTYHFNGTDYDYDVIHDDQLAHVINVYNLATDDKNYIGMAFFHIPLYEYQKAYDEYLAATNPENVGQGSFLEGVLYPYKNNGSYNELRKANVVAFVCGHNHINYGDFIYCENSENASERAIFSFGVKSSNLLYHSEDMIGYKTITLKDISVIDFVSINNLNENFNNVTEGYKNYENN